MLLSMLPWRIFRVSFLRACFNIHAVITTTNFLICGMTTFVQKGVHSRFLKALRIAYDSSIGAKYSNFLTTDFRNSSFSSGVQKFERFAALQNHLDSPTYTTIAEL
ncbi:hypothetical protein O6H91_09G080900 [Diphasiastrum complanatum]|uniref:Uncharacterized protein n=1 Tax=Diphasiastrum complanatum TaxID=34168 RepID=A0ACC2CRA6_DIPCM|nr:hypothetical protein O6H91_09G080900 [Diphasiastrum complanatum]